MAAADVSLELDTKDRIRFAHSPWKALAFALISLGFTLLCWFAIRDDDVIRYGFTAFSLLFLVAGVLGIFWRLELDIDLARRRVRQVRGMWPNPKTRLRNLDDADGVWLRLEYRSTGNKNNRRKVPWWFVSLKFPDEKTGTRLIATRSEVEGYRKWEYFAKRLNIAAVDHTAEAPQRRSPGTLDETLTPDAAASKNGSPRLPVQPADSRAEIKVEGGRKTIVLPPLGFSGGLVFLALFGSAFVVLGGSALLASLGVIDMQIQGSPWAVRLIPPVFVCAGLGIIWLGVRGSFSSLVLGLKADSLYTEQLVFGKRSGRESIRLSEIESIDVAGDVQSRHRRGAHIKIAGVAIGRSSYRERDSEVVLRSDQKILRFGGFLSQTEKEWLADVCRFAARHGVLA